MINVHDCEDETEVVRKLHFQLHILLMLRASRLYDGRRKEAFENCERQQSGSGKARLLTTYYHCKWEKIGGHIGCIATDTIS